MPNGEYLGRNCHTQKSTYTEHGCHYPEWKTQHMTLTRGEIHMHCAFAMQCTDDSH